MKPRTQFLFAISLIILILGITWISFSRRDQEPVQTLQATINRDCAPWDGSAFTVSVPMKDRTIIYISIWQSPDIPVPVTFSFPDETGQTGFAYILPELDPLQQLTGKVSFQRVEQGIPVEGEFNFMTESGKQFNGRFKAEWGNEIIYCG